MKKFATIIIASLSLAGAAQAQSLTVNQIQPLTANQISRFCGGLDATYGPFDYRKGKSELEKELKMVEKAHFTEDIAFGIRGNTGFLAQDLEYTLRAFPNHAGALGIMMRLALRDKQLTLPYGSRPVECFFDRAARFAMDDPTVHALYGSYLFGRAKDDDRQRALDMFLTSLALAPDNAPVNYNVGLAYFSKGKFKEANRYAQKAYAGGFPLPGLKNMLVKAGAWDPSAPPPDPSQAGGPAAAKTAAEAKAAAAAAKPAIGIDGAPAVASPALAPDAVAPAPAVPAPVPAALTTVPVTVPAPQR